MLRITTEENGRATQFRLEGKLKGDWVPELERCWFRLKNRGPEMQVVVELSKVDYVDESGRVLLTWMVSHGATLKATSNLVIAALAEEIDHFLGRCHPATGHE